MLFQKLKKLALAVLITNLSLFSVNAFAEECKCAKDCTDCQKEDCPCVKGDTPCTTEDCDCKEEDCKRDIPEEK